MVGMLDLEILRCEELVEVMKIMMIVIVVFCEEKFFIVGFIFFLLGKLRKYFIFCEIDLV